MLKQYLLKLSLFAVSFLAFANFAIGQATVSVPGVGDIYAIGASFGPSLAEEINVDIVLVEDDMDPTSDGCQDLVNDVAGKIALVDRGACAFTVKALTAQAGGAIAVIIGNNDAANPNQLFIPGGDDMGEVTIPVLGISYGAADAIKMALMDGAVTPTLVPSANNLCVSAQAIEPGTYMVDSIFADPVLSGLGGAPSHPDDNTTAAAWYSFTPTEDGLMSVNSCEGGADTRLWIHTGSCDVIGLSLATIAQNDDACAYIAGNEDELYASSVEVPVTAGTTYYIEFDNRWDANGFPFTLDFTAGAVELAPGQDCANAIAIDPGTHTIDAVTPYGQTGLYNLNGSQWYTFTPNITGIMNVSSCGGGSDTRLIIHEGACGAFNTIIAGGDVDDVCPAFEGDTDNLAAAAEGLTVTAGTTYYIEWSGRWDTNGFDFTVSLDNLPPVAATFIVDMTNETVTEDGVIMVWAPSNAMSQADAVVVMMTNDDGDSKWEATIELTTSDTLGYFFINGGLATENFEMVPDECGLDGGLGFNVRPLLVTATEAFTVGPVCFSKCTTCAPEDCSQPLVLIDDNIDDYTEGAIGPQADHWSTWSGTEGGAEDGIVSADAANTGAQSMKVEGAAAGGPQDILLLLGDKQEGHYALSWNILVPLESAAYYNIQKEEGNPGGEFGMQVFFNTDGTGSLDAAGGAAATFDYTQDSWVSVTHYIDLDNDVIRLFIDGSFVYSWPFSATTGDVGGLLQLGAIDFYPLDGTNLFYIDDVSYAQLPAASAGQYCYLADTAVAGTNTASDISCFGAGLSVQSNGGGTGGHWFSYTATADGAIAVGTCDNGGVDTRLWVFDGGCSVLNTVGVNDDMCPMGAGLDNYASYREVPVTAGETYYIMFDDIWDARGFEWTLTEIPGDLAAGDFCESAMEIAPGTITIDTLSSDAAIAGPSIGYFVSSTTPYANSRFYQFTPTENGFMSVYSCETLPEETAVYIYTGECGLSSLELVATDANGCDPESSTQLLAVTAGTTYYIEWASEAAGDRSGFDFELEFGGSQVNVVFEVDMNQLDQNGTLSAQGAFIGGSFTDGRVRMDDTDGDNIYRYEVELFKGDTLTWNFYNGSIIKESINADLGGSGCTLGGDERFGIVAETDTRFATVCFASCASCEAVVNVDDALFGQALRVFPNPATEFTTVQYDFNTATDILINVTNALGQEVRTLQVQNALTGSTRIELADLPAGAYSVNVTDGTRKQTKVIMIQN